MNDEKTIAIFDLDKTLTPFDCDEAWGLFLHERGSDGPDFLSRQAEFFAQYDAGTLDILKYQRFSIGATHIFVIHAVVDALGISDLFSIELALLASRPRLPALRCGAPLLL